MKLTLKQFKNNVGIKNTIFLRAVKNIKGECSESVSEPCR